jgi:hypothetical protein
MHYVDMVTRLAHFPGMEPTWPYPWAVGSGRPLLTPEEITKHQRGENDPLPEYVLQAIRDARAQVLHEGFKDSPLTDEEKVGLQQNLLGIGGYSVSADGAVSKQYQLAESQADVSMQSEARDEPARSDQVGPLPVSLVKLIEEKARNACGPIKCQTPALSDMQKNARVLGNNAELDGYGIRSFDSIPTQSTKRLTRALEQGLVLLDSTSLALSCAEHLKWSKQYENEDTLYARVCVEDTTRELASDKEQAYAFSGVERPVYSSVEASGTKVGEDSEPTRGVGSSSTTGRADAGGERAKVRKGYQSIKPALGAGTSSSTGRADTGGDGRTATKRVYWR